MILRKILLINGILLGLFVFFCLPARPVHAQDQQAAPPYSMEEYNAIQGAMGEKDPRARIKLLDGFVAKFPKSTLMSYANNSYYQTYNQLKDYPKTIEYADKLIADEADVATRLTAIQVRCQVFPAVFNPKAPDANNQLVKERDTALLGAKILEAFPKPADSKMTDADFNEQKKPGLVLFYSSAASADFQLKDYPATVGAYKSELTDNPNDAVAYYHIGVSYLSTTPPQTLDGYWMLARAINMKITGSPQVKDYLKKQMMAYEQPGCDSLIDAQLNELLQLAGTSGERPATYSIPSAADLDKIRSASNILSVISDLSAGGDKSKITWLALCSAQFPEVVGKIIDVQKGDGFVDFLAYTGATQEDMEKGTVANLDVKVWTSTPPASKTADGSSNSIPAQPDVVRLQKDDGIRFSGTLVSYDPSPFLLHWDQVKVDPTIIPEGKPEPGKRRPRAAPPKQ